MVHLYFVCKADRLILRFQYQNTNRGWYAYGFSFSLFTILKVIE